MTTSRRGDDDNRVICDRCLATMLGIYPDDKQDDVLKSYYDLPHANLVRSLNDYVSQIESVIPSKVH